MSNDPSLVLEMADKPSPGDSLLVLLEAIEPRRNKQGKVFVKLPETQEDGRRTFAAYCVENERVEWWLRLQLRKAKGKRADQSEVREARQIMSELAFKYPPGETPVSFKAQALFKVVVNYTRVWLDKKREPADLLKELIDHAHNFELLDQGEELPGSEDALTPMLNRLKPRLAAAGVEVETGKSGEKRYIRLKWRAGGQDTLTPPDSSPANEVSVPSPAVPDRYEKPDTAEIDMADIEAAAKGGAA